MMRALPVLVAFAALSLSGPTHAADSAPTVGTGAAQMSGESLQALAALALERNPRIQSAIANHRAAIEDVPQARGLPDPRLSFRHFVEPVETRVGPQNNAIGISQTLPWFGKLKWQAEVASRGAQVAAQTIRVVSNDVLATLALAWYDLQFLQRSIHIVRGNRDLVLHLERVARTRYGAGAAAHPDVIRAQVELGRLEDELASLRDRRGTLLAQINALLARPYDTPVTVPAEVPIQVVDATDEELLARVLNGNPALRVLNQEAGVARAVKKRAEQDFYPDVSLGLEYIATGDARTPGVRGSGRDPLVASISLTLPLWTSRYRAGVRGTQADVASAISRIDDARNTLRSHAVDALVRLRDATRQIALYENTLLPKAGESLAATQRGYSAGSSSFSDLVDAQRVLLSFELSHARAVTDHHRARVSLEELMGAGTVSSTSQEVHDAE